MKRQIADRVFFGCYSLIVASIALWERASVSYRLVSEGGSTAMLCLLAFCALSFLSLIDTFINDILPARFRFQYGEKIRQRLWLVIAVAFACHAYAIVQGGSLLTGLLYFGVAFRCSAISYIDLHGKVQDKVRMRREDDFAPSHVSL